MFREITLTIIFILFSYLAKSQNFMIPEISGNLYDNSLSLVVYKKHVKEVNLKNYEISKNTLIKIFQDCKKSSSLEKNLMNVGFIFRVNFQNKNYFENENVILNFENSKEINKQSMLVLAYFKGFDVKRKSFIFENCKIISSF